MAYRADQSQMPSSTTEVPERSIGRLVSDATADIQMIVKNEVELAKLEISRDAKAAGKGVAMFGVAGVFGLYALTMLLFAAAYGLVKAGLDWWLAFLVVALVLLLVAGVLAFLGKGALGKMEGGPKRAVRQAKLTAEAVKPAKQADVTAPGVTDDRIIERSSATQPVGTLGGTAGTTGTSGATRV